MSQVLYSFSRLFGFKRLKSIVLLLVLSVLLLIIYFNFFTLHMEHEQVSDSEKVKVSQERPKSKIFRKRNSSEPDQGQVSMHVFEDWCGTSVEQLRRNVLYPLFPHIQTTISSLAVYPGQKNYGLRIFGYIHPSASGQYIFAISSDKNSEFWLSLNEEPQNIRLLAYIGRTGAEWSAPGEYGKFASQKSQPATLSKKKKYFFEVLYQQNEGVDHLEVAWRQNHRNNRFTVITSEYLSLYINESSPTLGGTAHIPQTAASHEMISEPPHPEVDMVREDPRDSIYNIPLINASRLRNVFPQCDYKPIHVFRGRQMQRFQGVFHVYFSEVYPNDYTRQTHAANDEELCFYKKDEKFDKGGGFVQYLKPENSAKKEKSDPNWEKAIYIDPVDFHSKQPTRVTDVCRRAGNIIMEETEVMPVVDAFINQLRTAKSNSDLVLKRVLNVERKEDRDVGSRYLLELELEDGQNQILMVSQYFYVEKSSSKEGPVSVEWLSLCSPQDFSWDPSVRVDVLLTVKNQGRWVIQFIRQMANIYQTTGDKNFNVIIIDYSSDDLDIQAALKNAKLPSYQYRRLEGRFLKTTALQTAIDISEDENSILFICDLHFNFPTSIIHTIRKHTVRGKMVFAPVVMRLDCGSTAQAPTGFWELSGYGPLGIYKSDMKRIGGMNTIEFKDKWGGEDWELLDRILSNKLEVERLNLRNFLHFHHSKRGMWNN
ncbi:beta-1,4-N-acetylgalactosaminyltransferase 3-like isoform X2 [Astyanax mexicanus]|uniref:Beta-1,4-N-acetylgalactosaminyltransferase n=2 Tax=Astyanax mexicanus TaxID=7994 RepID=A0A8T2MAX1_ASTMX|nr:beta-1,4-N-acetylgalactosaminyltransferase 3-like isoform X2 [Astyanax mexicanus]